jgi:hypothetical protein
MYVLVFFTVVHTFPTAVRISSYSKIKKLILVNIIVADQDPGSGVFLPPEPGIRIRGNFFLIPDPALFLGDYFTFSSEFYF